MSDQIEKKEADNGAKKNPWVFLWIGLVLIIATVMYFYSKENVIKEVKIEEENYAITKAAPSNEAEVSKTQALPQQPAHVKQPVTLTPEQVAFIQEEQRKIQETQRKLQERLEAPLMVVNNTVDTPKAMTSNHGNLVSDPNTRFLNQVSTHTAETVKAERLDNLNYLIAEGHFIHAVMESASNSDLPGPLRAVVTEPVYSENGSQVLIEPGSKLIGQYKSGLLQGASRIFVVWTRLITPEGISVQLGSPGTDELGVAGNGADEIDRHFWQRFGTGALLSLLGAGAANIGVSNSDQLNSASEYRSAVASSFAQSANEALQRDSSISPTLKSYQGKKLNVYINKDIDFRAAMQTKLQPYMIF